MTKPQSLLSNRYPIDKETEAIVAVSNKLERGALVKRGEIETTTGLKYEVYPWQRLITAWKKRLLGERGIALLAEVGVGFRLATVDEQFAKADRVEKSGGRRQNFAAGMVAVIPSSELSDAGNSLQKEMVSANNAVQTLRKEKAAERKSLLSMQPSLPRLGVNGRDQPPAA